MLTTIHQKMPKKKDLQIPEIRIWTSLEVTLYYKGFDKELE